MEPLTPDKPVPRGAPVPPADERRILRETQRAVTVFGGLSVWDFSARPA